MKRQEKALILMELTGPRAPEYAALGRQLNQLAESLDLPRLPDQSAAFAMPDDSMEPYILKGEPLLADREVTRRREGGVFAVSLGADLLVRRTDRDAAGDWRLVSENPAWKPVLWPAHAVMIGEVLWGMRNLSRGDVLR